MNIIKKILLNIKTVQPKLKPVFLGDWGNVFLDNNEIQVRPSCHLDKVKKLSLSGELVEVVEDLGDCVQLQWNDITFEVLKSSFRSVNLKAKYRWEDCVPVNHKRAKVGFVVSIKYHGIENDIFYKMRIGGKKSNLRFFQRDLP